MAAKARSSYKTISSASQAILLAEPGLLIGKYKVSANQVKPHPNQRSLNPEWVDSLHQRFLEAGVDRAAHPIKVLLERNKDAESLMQGSSQGDPLDVVELPKPMVVFVYHGQHRIAACQKMEDTQEHWWYAEVYKPGMCLEPQPCSLQLSVSRARD